MGVKRKVDVMSRWLLGMVAVGVIVIGAIVAVYGGKVGIGMGGVMVVAGLLGLGKVR